MNTWTMHVENFGKIKSAEIEVSPLTLFVGENNSGKSYLMTLIYGLLNLNFYYDQYAFDEQSENYSRCVQFIDRILQGEKQMDDSFRQIEMDNEDVSTFEGILNELLSMNKENFVKNLFNKSIDIGHLSLKFHRKNKYVLMYHIALSTDQIKHITLMGMSDKVYPTIERACQVGRKDNQYSYNSLLSFILQYMIWGDFQAPVYFPTARTGYILTYNALVESALKDKFNLNTAQKNLLTRPNSDFLTKLSGIAGNNHSDAKSESLFNRTQAAVRIIEKNIIKGQVSVSDLPAHEIFYYPRETDLQLPMFVTSGVVTEMTPLLLFFKNGAAETVLIEEPEISLHPQLQCEMARVLVRLANYEIPVFVTTHSDLIIQHINNMIKLSVIPDRDSIAEKLGYEKCDWIERDKVHVYQFNVDDNQKTTVTKLSCGEYGFEAMTFYDTMEQLNRQTMMIEEA